MITIQFYTCLINIILKSWSTKNNFQYLWVMKALISIELPNWPAMNDIIWWLENLDLLFKRISRASKQIFPLLFLTSEVFGHFRWYDTWYPQKARKLCKIRWAFDNFFSFLHQFLKSWANFAWNIRIQKVVKSWKSRVRKRSFSIEKFMSLVDTVIESSSLV